MKAIKTSLLFVLAAHLWGVISVNFFGLKGFNEKAYYNQLNPVGKKIVSCFSSFAYPKPVKTAMDIYTYYTGTSIGNEFYSPNVSSAPADFIFLVDGRPSKLPLVSFEGNTKSIAAVFFYIKSLQHKNLGDSIMKSLCLRLLATNPSAQSVNAYLGFTKLNKLDSAAVPVPDSLNKKLLLCAINRNNLHGKL